MIQFNPPEWFFLLPLLLAGTTVLMVSPYIGLI